MHFTHELGIVSIGKFIDTLWVIHYLLEKPVNCCQHVQDLKAIEDRRYRNICLDLITKNEQIIFSELAPTHTVYEEHAIVTDLRKSFVMRKFFKSCLRQKILT